MRRKYLFVIAFLLLVLCGCTGSKEDPNPPDETGMGSDTSRESDSTLKMIVDFHGISKAGYYEILLNNDWTANILYTDVMTKQRIYLSPELTSDHHTESDTSFISYVGGGISVFVVDDILFLNHYGDSDVTGGLYAANLNGGNRKQLLSYTDYGRLDGAVACDEQYLYTILGKGINEEALVRIDYSSGKIEELKFPGNSAPLLMSAFEDHLIIKIIEFPDSPENYYDQTHVVYLYSLKDQSMNEILRWKQDKIHETYCDRYIYMLDQSSDSLIELNALTGERKSIIPSLKDCGLAYNERDYMLPVFDGHLIWTQWNVEKNDSDFKTFDLESGELSELNSIPGCDWLVLIGTYGDEYLVMTDDLIIPIDDKAPDGTPITVMKHMRNLALIKKEDLWANNFKFTEIRNTFLEE